MQIGTAILRSNLEARWLNLKGNEIPRGIVNFQMENGYMLWSSNSTYSVFCFTSGGYHQILNLETCRHFYGDTGCRAQDQGLKDVDLGEDPLPALPGFQMVAISLCGHITSSVYGVCWKISFAFSSYRSTNLMMKVLS